MGTFTKSFGAMGGYISGSEELIAALRAETSGFLADNAMSPVVCQQILTAFKVIMGADGTKIGASKLLRLKDNSNYFRERLMGLGTCLPPHHRHYTAPGLISFVAGCEVFGDRYSPVIPLMVYNPTKVAAFSRQCLARGVCYIPLIPHMHPSGNVSDALTVQLAVVVVGFPATPVLLARARFCVSAGHTREDLDKALKIIDEVCNLLHLKYRKSAIG
jgi:serine palmitoyltransferase